MFRRTLFMLLALATVIFASPAVLRAQSGDNTTAVEMQVPLPPYSLSDLKPKKCEPGAYDRSSLDCAQWKAADAAEASAVWAARSFWLGVIAALVGGFTLFAAGYAAHYAKKAAIATRQAATAALQANQQSRDLFVAENRPWLKITSAGFQSLLDGDENDILVINIKNVGRDHAIHVSVRNAHTFNPLPTLAPNALLKIMGQAGSNEQYDHLALFSGDEEYLVPSNPIIDDQTTSGVVEICVSYRGTADRAREYKTACFVDISGSKCRIRNHGFIVT